MRCVYASSKSKQDDYSEITEEIRGRKVRVVLNIFIILYSYGFCMCYCTLIYSLFGRFIIVRDIIQNMYIIITFSIKDGERYILNLLFMLELVSSSL